MTIWTRAELDRMGNAEELEMWGFLLWREVPTWLTWAGALLTLSSGLYILYRERRPETGLIRENIS